MKLQLSNIADAVAEVDQLPRVDWEVVNRWLETRVRKGAFSGSLSESILDS